MPGGKARRSRGGGGSRPRPRRLGAAPGRTVAIEDSAPGIASALGAGLHVVAVPSEITSHTDLSAAHRHVASLDHLQVADLVALAAG